MVDEASFPTYPLRPRGPRCTRGLNPCCRMKAPNAWLLGKTRQGAFISPLARKCHMTQRWSLALQPGVCAATAPPRWAADESRLESPTKVDVWLWGKPPLSLHQNGAIAHDGHRENRILENRLLKPLIRVLGTVITQVRNFHSSGLTSYIIKWLAYGGDVVFYRFRRGMRPKLENVSSTCYRSGGKRGVRHLSVSCLQPSHPLTENFPKKWGCGVTGEVSRDIRGYDCDRVETGFRERLAPQGSQHRACPTKVWITSRCQVHSGRHKWLVWEALEKASSF